MTKQLNIRIPDEVAEQLSKTAEINGVTITKLVADAIALSIALRDNMVQNQSRLVIENPKNAPDEHYKLWIPVS